MEKIDPRYVKVLEEIKWRTTQIGELSKMGVSGQSSLSVYTECAYLQFRKILELIAMSSLVANRKELNKSVKRLGEMWKGKEILEMVEEVNPKFYPVPIIEEPSPKPFVKNNLIEKDSGFLSKEDFTVLYNKCSKIIHADNPLGKKTDYGALYSEGQGWLTKITGLLNCHKITLVGQDGFYLVHMKEERDNDVHMYEFVPKK